MNKTLFFLVLLAALFLASCSNQKNVWVEGWQSVEPLNIPRAGAATVVVNNVIYVIGGIDGKNFLESVEYTHITEDGLIGPWKYTQSLPDAIGFTAAVAHQGFIYVAGGGNGNHGKNLLNRVIRAKVMTDGQLGPWAEQAAMSLPRRCAKLLVHENSLYTFGGFGGTLLDTVEKSDFGQDNNLSSWTLETNKLTTPRYVNSLQKVGSVAYLMGGHHPERGEGLRSVEFAHLNSKQLTWKKSSPMLTPRYGLSSATLGEYIFALGGISGTEYLTTTEVSNVTNNKEITAWKMNTELPFAMANFSTIVHNNKIILIGGVMPEGYLRNISLAEIDARGRFGFWATPEQAHVYETNKTAQLKSRQELPNQGKILEIIQTEQYSYIRLEINQQEIWLAGPVTMLAVGDEIEFSKGVTMSNFYSKSLAKNFQKIVFVGELVRKKQH